MSRVELTRLRAGLRAVRQLFSYDALPLGQIDRQTPSVLAAATHPNEDDAFTATISALGAQGPRRVVESLPLVNPLHVDGPGSAAPDHDDSPDDHGFDHLVVN